VGEDSWSCGVVCEVVWWGSAMCQEQQLPVAGSRTRASRNPTVAMTPKRATARDQLTWGRREGKKMASRAYVQGRSCGSGMRMWEEVWRAGLCRWAVKGTKPEIPTMGGDEMLHTARSVALVQRTRRMTIGLSGTPAIAVSRCRSLTVPCVSLCFGTV
jgi:hypothetical protein